MSRNRTPQHGDGTAWLVADRLAGDYVCSWYIGTHSGRLVQGARVPTAAEAVAWGRSRTSRVRIRTAEACTYWAGTAPRPAGFSHTWTDSHTSDAAHLPPRDDSQPPLGVGPAGTVGEPLMPGGSAC
jgi:hypothetical protein